MEQAKMDINNIRKLLNVSRKIASFRQQLDAVSLNTPVS